MNFGYYFFTLVAFGIASLLYVEHSLRYLWAWSFDPVPSHSPDFLVVGGGTGGSTVAGRLAEAGFDVILIEAGGYPHRLQSVPLLYPTFLHSPYDWSYLSEPQEHAMQAMDESRSAWSSGKGLGGSSNLNAMIYMRGHSKDYDEWGEQFDIRGWDFQDVHRIFEKSLARSPDGIQMKVADKPKLTQKFSDVVVEAFQEMGLPKANLNEDAQNGGVNYAQLTVNEYGSRQSNYEAFAAPFANKKLTVLPYTEVVKVLFNEHDAAIGVQAQRFGEAFRIFAKKEVIISSGAVGSPKLLMLSGIGPRDHLNDIGIPVLKDIPVGDNLQDHIFSIYNAVSKGSYSMSPLAGLNPLNLLSYFWDGAGPLTDNSCSALALVRTPIAAKTDPRPDIQFHALSAAPSLDYGAHVWKATNWNWEHFLNFYRGQLGKDVSTLAPTLLRPKSRGFVRLRDRNPQSPPIIQPNYLTHPDDIDTLVEGLKMAHEVITATEAFKRHEFRPVRPYLDACGEFEPTNDRYWRCYVKHITFSLYHPVGTCAMGTVVDSDLRVRGIGNLRVVDASVMPKIVGGNTNAPVTMIAEMAAEKIIRNWS